MHPHTLGDIEQSEHQELVDQHFDDFSRHWRDLYAEETLEGVIHQERKALTLAWIDGLRLERGARILDAGCGAGLLATDLAERGYIVHGIDTSERMLELARERAGSLGLSEVATFDIGDAHRLDEESGSCALVVALGVIPYLHTPVVALREMARVLEPGGSVLVSSDNRFRVNHLLDPRRTPMLPGRDGLARLYHRRVRHATGPPNRFLSYATVGRALAEAGFVVDRRVTLGYGPFTLFDRRLFSEARSVELHRRLTRLARRSGLLARVGAQHVLLAHTRREVRSPRDGSGAPTPGAA